MRCLKFNPSITRCLRFSTTIARCPMFKVVILSGTHNPNISKCLRHSHMSMIHGDIMICLFSTVTSLFNLFSREILKYHMLHLSCIVKLPMFNQNTTKSLKLHPLCIAKLPMANRSTTISPILKLSNTKNVRSSRNPMRCLMLNPSIPANIRFATSRFNFLLTRIITRRRLRTITSNTKRWFRS